MLGAREDERVVELALPQQPQQEELRLELLLRYGVDLLPHARGGRRGALDVQHGRVAHQLMRQGDDRPRDRRGEQHRLIDREESGRECA